jgi:hypothetical protein
MRLSILIVSWNVRQDIVNCVRSIEQDPPQAEFEIIVIDNASEDGTVEVLRHDFPQVTLIANDENHGFAAANNQGIAGSRGEYVLLLNPDTILHPHSLDTLCAFLDGHPDVGACGPRLLNEDGTLQPSAIAGWSCDLMGGVLLYLVSLLTFSRVRRDKSRTTIRNSAIRLTRYSWWLLFRA